MASGWAKSLHCKSNALEDVVYLPKSSNKSVSLSCSSSSQTLRDVIFLIPNRFPLPPQKTPQKPKPHAHSTPPDQTPKPNPKTKSKSKSSSSSLSDLPRQHSSRRIVELIFASSWSSPFPGEIEMLFRVHQNPRSVARFEDHRAAVRSRSDDPRCAADGNEMMRFHSAVAAAAAGKIYNAAVSLCTLGDFKGVRTFAGSAAAHGRTAAAGSARRAMLLCRVIAGRVIDGSNSDSDSEPDSVCFGKGELLVLDPRAVLPCFLIIYNILS